MKLIPLTILTISLAVDLKAHEHFTFPPQFQTPHAGVLSTESSHYLPPESHTTIPLFPMRNVNSLPYQYLPPIGKKPPMGFPSPFPKMVSSTIMPSHDEDDDDDDNENNKRTPPGPPLIRNQFNHTTGNPNRQVIENKEMRSVPRPKNYHHNIDRIDTKLPYQFNANPYSPSSTVQSPAVRNLIISGETNRNDRSIDQMKAGGFPQYLPQQGVSFISSTTEPAIPILRLSNEMDLDGSFSYEALGADQTHYVQHSHMENMGTEKEEQVVEGSYSYVGDNGQTYTVHYIADSNGFRASGDLLPVAPPIPEIIQRAVQYNLAEEARKPPHLKSWQSEEKENELSESEKSHRFAISPPRNLFTGKTPESFSYAFSQGSNAQNNLAAASSQAPIKTNIEFTPDQMKGTTNSGTISPQITFLASQGAHVPSMNTAQQTISRMFSTEKPTMPQLINYEAGMKESEQDTNKALWRWQYGLNANLNQISDKNTISRSFGEGDDVMINFSDMTPEQYTKMIKSEIEPSGKEHFETHQINDNTNVKQTHNYNTNTVQAIQANTVNEYQTQHPNYQYPTTKEYTTESAITPSYSKDSYVIANPYIKQNDRNVKNHFENHESIPNSRSNLITHHEFIPPSQTVTQSYDYEDISYEPRRIKFINADSHTETDIDDLKVIPLNNNNDDKTMSSDYARPNNFENKSKNQMYMTNMPPYSSSTTNSIKFTDFIVSDDKNQFKPVINTEANVQYIESTTTTEKSLNDMLRANIFLKNIFHTEDTEQSNFDKSGDDEQNSFDKFSYDEPSSFEKSQEEKKQTIANKINSENKIDKSPKYIQYQPQPHNGMKNIKQKPIDISELLNYMTMKNHFESSKIRPKSNNNNNLNRITEARYIPVNQDNNDESHEEIREQAYYKPYNHQQQQELRGIIKNYKVLHRNNSQLIANDNHKQLKRNLSPPPLKMVQTSNLPPLGRAGPSMKSYLPPIYV